MSDLATERRGPVLRLRIERPERRNALSAEVLAGLVAAARDPGDARVLLVESSGEVFSSGADLSAISPAAGPVQAHEARSGLRDWILAARACPVPVLTRVQGRCLAGGLGLVLGADLAVASAAATFALPEVEVGLWPFLVGALLARHADPKHALDLMLTARPLDAAQAERLGLVSRVVEPARLDAELEELCARLAGRPPLAVRLGKAAFWAAQEASLPAALEAMQAQLSLLLTTADAAEGLAAFRDRRAPTWTGR